MITRLLKTFLASVAVVLLLTNSRAQDSSAQEHNPLMQLNKSLQRVITKVNPAIVTVEVLVMFAPTMTPTTRIQRAAQ